MEIVPGRAGGELVGDQRERERYIYIYIEREREREREREEMGGMEGDQQGRAQGVRSESWSPSNLQRIPWRAVLLAARLQQAASNPAASRAPHRNMRRAGLVGEGRRNGEARAPRSKIPTTGLNRAPGSLTHPSRTEGSPGASSLRRRARSAREASFENRDGCLSSMGRR